MDLLILIFWANKIGSFFYFCFIYGLVSKSHYKFVMKDLNVGVRFKDNWHSGLLSKTCKVERSWKCALEKRVCFTVLSGHDLVTCVLVKMCDVFGWLSLSRNIYCTCTYVVKNIVKFYEVSSMLIVQTSDFFFKLKKGYVILSSFSIFSPYKL